VFFHFLYGSKMFNIPLFFKIVHYTPSVGVSIVS
jgi:hypothetical protein